MEQTLKYKFKLIKVSYSYMASLKLLFFWNFFRENANGPFCNGEFQHNGFKFLSPDFQNIQVCIQEKFQYLHA